MSDEKQDPCCKNCYYSLSRTSQLTQTQGITPKLDWYCRRFPPVAGNVGFATVSPSDWCGEWHEETD